MGSRSTSDGELLDSEVEHKATTAQPSRKDVSVNRKLRDALSPSPEPSPRSPTASSFSIRSRSRERSRSPYRADRFSRGEKRRRHGDYSDRSHTEPRRHRESGHSSASNPRSRLSYDDLDQGKPERSNLSYDDHTRASDRYRDKRQRTRSPSPFRHDRAVDRHFTHDRAERHGVTSQMRAGSDLERGPKDRKRHNQSFGKSSVNAGKHVPDADARRSRRDVENASPSAAQGPRVSFSLGTDDRTPSSNDAVNGGAAKEPVIEAATIEERRKRREAIKAKYKDSAPPLLVQALQHSNVSDGGIPALHSPGEQSERSVSPPNSSPATPQHDSAASSPPDVAVSDDQELANKTLDGNLDEQTDEPAAADYDPTADMQEDRKRYDKRTRELDASADEQLEIELGVSLGNQAKLEESPPGSLKRSADDMFASDDDDDMFAPTATRKRTASSSDPRSNIVKQAKQLDMSLLDNWDDHEGYYRIILGELLDGRYHVQSNLGKGMFSSVVRAHDDHTNSLVAIKVIRNNETMIKAAAKEMDILQKLATADPDDKKHMIRLERSFTHKGHLCMVFENLSINLREVLKKFGRDVGINLKAVRSYAQQMFLGLSLLRKCQILHADLKPDNVLVNESRNMLKICDLGSATDAAEAATDITPYLVSRFYRAPEIILGMPYDCAIDMWSIGCTLFELYTGKILFTGRTNNQMLRAIMECRGKFSLKMLKKAEFGGVHFDDANLNFRSVERDRLSGRDVVKLINFAGPTRDLRSRLFAAAASGGKAGPSSLPQAEQKELTLFADLLDKCLRLNPESRIAPVDALKHPFIHRTSTK